MADVVDVRIGQRVMTEFLTVEGSSLKAIQRRMRSVYSEDAIDVRSDSVSVLSTALIRTLMTGP
jgi:hypothetical protein